MAIEVNSAGWTGQEPAAAPDTAPQVCGAFDSPEKLQEAMSRLEGSDFQRADLSLRLAGAAESGAEEPVREDDTQNLRQLGVGIGAYVAAAAAAGVVVATGGAALPAVAAAAAAGGGAVAAGEAAGQAATPAGQTAAQQAASAGGATLLVSAATPEKQSKAEAVLRAAGAVRVWRQDAA
jgi:hypothetical protein